MDPRERRDGAGKTVWQYPHASRDGWVLANGNILLALGKSKDYPGGAYGRYGFRVPFIAVSPWAKPHYVSHMTYDHTSILKFIETKFNLPALTRRDANANGLADLFDFKRPVPKAP